MAKGKTHDKLRPGPVTQRMNLQLGQDALQGCLAKDITLARRGRIRACRVKDPIDGIDIEPVKSGQQRKDARAAPIQLGQPCEVGRERAESSQQLFDKGVLMLEPEQGVGGALASQRGRAVSAAGCGTACTPRVGSGPSATRVGR